MQLKVSVLSLIAGIFLACCSQGIHAQERPARSARFAGLQLEMRTTLQSQMSAKTQMSAGGTAGFKLHRRREKIHLWSKPCRRLPMAKRAACERKVDGDVLHDKTWVPLKSLRGAAAFTVKLDHD